MQAKMISLTDWFMKRGFVFKQASDAARSVDIEASRYLSTASEIAFWNADALNRISMYEAEGAIIVEEVDDKIPVITIIDEAALENGGVDGVLLPKLEKLANQRLNMEFVLKNGGMKDEEFESLIFYPAVTSNLWSMPGLASAAANRIWIKLHQKAGMMHPSKPAFAYPPAIDIRQDDQRFRNYYIEPDLICPVCGAVYYTHKRDERGVPTEYVSLDDEWRCYSCSGCLNTMMPYPVYRRIY